MQPPCEDHGHCWGMSPADRARSVRRELAGLERLSVLHVGKRDEYARGRKDAVFFHGQR